VFIGLWRYRLLQQHFDKCLRSARRSKEKVTYSCLCVESLEETYPTAGLIQDWHKHRTVNSIRSSPPPRTGCVLNSDRSS
jgi:hypothetical protein